MPIYEYKCIVCQNVQQVRNSMEGAMDIEMCSCGGEAKKIISLPGLPNFGFKAYHTKNINGKNEHVTSRGHERILMKANNMALE